MRARLRDWWLAALAAFLWLVVCPLVARGATIGEQVTYTGPAGVRWCATVAEVDTGVDGLPWAWVTINAAPGRVFHVRTSELGQGCRA